MTQAELGADGVANQSLVMSLIRSNKVTPVIEAAAYVANDLLADKITFPNAARDTGGTGIIQSLRITDLASQDAGSDIVFFDSDPSATTFTKNSPLTINAADIPKIIGVIPVVTSDYVDFVANSVATLASIGLAFVASDSKDLFAAIVTRGTPTYASVADLEIALGLIQD